MSTTSLRKLTLLLAGSGLSLSEIERAVMELQRNDPYDVVAQIDHLRREMAKSFERRRHEPTWEYVRDHPIRIRETLFSHSDIGERVEDLLKHQAGLGTSQAFDLLVESLMKAGALHGDDVPPLSRKSLSNWVGRLSNVVPQKLILSHATQIRNSFVNSPGADWRLGPEIP